MNRAAQEAQLLIVSVQQACGRIHGHDEHLKPDARGFVQEMRVHVQFIIVAAACVQAHKIHARSFGAGHVLGKNVEQAQGKEVFAAQGDGVAATRVRGYGIGVYSLYGAAKSGVPGGLQRHAFGKTHVDSAVVVAAPRLAVQLHVPARLRGRGHGVRQRRERED